MNTFVNEDLARARQREARADAVSHRLGRALRAQRRVARAEREVLHAQRQARRAAVEARRAVEASSAVRV